MCNPIAPPNTLKKNKNKIPIPNLTALCAKKRVGFIGAPINSSKTINATIIEITIVELKVFNSFSLSLLHMIGSLKKEPRVNVNDNEWHLNPDNGLHVIKTNTLIELYFVYINFLP